MRKRYTERDEYGNADIIDVDIDYTNFTFKELCTLTEALNKLAYFEDKQEMEVRAKNRLEEIIRVLESSPYIHFRLGSEDVELLKFALDSIKKNNGEIKNEWW